MTKKYLHPKLLEEQELPWSDAEKAATEHHKNYEAESLVTFEKPHYKRHSDLDNLGLFHKDK